MSATVLTTIAGGIARITLNRPAKRNALDRATIGALASELRSCAADPAVRVVQLSGAGNTFCAGADLT
jgi:enoyl-CoA hydratase/carnithine racemase